MNTKQLLNKIYKPTDWVFQKAAQTKRGTNIALISYVLLTGTLFGLAGNNLDYKSKYRKVEDKEVIEVENFYNITFSYDLSDFDSTRRAKKEKIGETPNELLDLLEPFSEGKFDRSLLKYENVRSIAKKMFC